MGLQKILITGGNGMVGRNVQGHPLAKAWEIYAPRKNELDLLDPNRTRDYISRIQPDVVIHAAGLVGGIQANIAYPVEFLFENMQMGFNLISAARKARVPRLLNIGSSCMYPREATNPLREEQILTGALEPTNEGYALAKIASMKLCEYIARTDRELNYKTIIPCNLYGPYDKFDVTSAHMIPDVIRKMHSAKLAGENKINIWNTGEARREFMFVGDLVNAIFRHIASEGTPSIMNIGLGHDYSILEYYLAIKQVVGWEGTLVHDMTKPEGMKQKLVDISRQTDWGWQTQTSLTDGLEQTYEYYLETMKGKAS